MNKLLFVSLFLLFACVAANAEVKISQLPLISGSNVGSSDSVPFVYNSGSETAQLHISDLFNVPSLASQLLPLAGANSITTLGTITTGTWHGTKISEAYGGTNQSTYTLGDILYSSGANTLSKLAGNTSSTRNFLRQTGTGSVSAAPAWDTLQVGDIPDLSATYSPVAGSSSITTVGTVTSGTWNATTLAINHGGTGQTTANAAFNALSPNTTKGDITAYGSTNTRLPVGSDGQVLTADSTQTLGVKWTAASSAITNNYFSGYFGHGIQWTSIGNSPPSWQDGTNSGGNTLTTRVSNGMTVTAGSSNVCGISWTPSASSAVYLVNVTISAFNTGAGHNNYFRLTDGTVVATVNSIQSQGTSEPQTITLSGIYVPGTSSAITLKVQFAVNNGNMSTVDWDSGIDNVTWNVVQIK